MVRARLVTGETMATLARDTANEQAFWPRMMVGIALFIVFGFAQFSARGFVDVPTVPLYVHLHGVIMLSWLALGIVQASLVRRDNIALHRRLGWLGVLLAGTVIALGSLVGIWAIETARVPPFFTDAYFLALTQVGVLIFGATVAAAVALRHRTEWHRRLMVGAMVLIMEPALGRLLPMPLMIPWGEWAAMAVQLLALGFVMRHDRKALGTIHPATLTAALIVIGAHVTVELLARQPWAIATAARLAGA